MHQLISVKKDSDIPAQYHGTPIQQLLEYHNLGRPFERYEKAQLLVGMCMDHRKHLIMPDNFAYIIRSGGANLRYSEFKVSYAIGVGGVQHIVLIGHDQCGMVNLHERRQLFIDGLMVNAGWSQEMAAEQFNNFAPLFELGNEIEFILNEAQRLRRRYPRVMVAPMYYQINQQELFLIKE